MLNQSMKAPRTWSQATRPPLGGGGLALLDEFLAGTSVSGWLWGSRLLSAAGEAERIFSLFMFCSELFVDEPDSAGGGGMLT